MKIYYKFINNNRFAAVKYKHHTWAPYPKEIAWTNSSYQSQYDYCYQIVILQYCNEWILYEQEATAE